jgi:hypothetical protein
MEVVYMGRRLTTSGKLAFCFIKKDMLEDEIHKYTGYVERNGDSSTLTENIEIKASLFSNLKARPSIGGIYTVRGMVDGDGRVSNMMVSKLVWSKEHFAHPILTGWTALSNASQEEARIKSLERKAGDNPELAQLIKELKRHYSHVSFAHRMSFKLWLMKELDKR